MNYLIFFTSLLISFTGYGQSSKSFFMPDDSTFCILVDNNIERRIAIDTSTFEEYYLFKKLNENKDLIDFFIIQFKDKSIEVNLEELVEKNFFDFEINNFDFAIFNGNNCVVFDSPYRNFTEFDSRGIIIERDDNYFILLFTYRKNSKNSEGDFEEILNSLLIN